MTSAQHSLTSPYVLDSVTAYQQWRESKLADYPEHADQLMVDIADPGALSQAEKAALLNGLRKTNIAFYRVTGARTDKQAIRQLGLQLGLARLDGNLCADDDSITSLRVVTEGRHRGYIPYTNKPLSWHSDGYYNPLDRQIHAILMHCDTPAPEGGQNALLDHEILYLLLRDEDPALISALMHPRAMSIPPNVEGGEEIRGETIGPVYSVSTDGHLHMRYSARTRNINWRDDANTARAVTRINEILASDCPYIFRYTLQANEGVISNNVLHNRSGFTDTSDVRRLLYRARYYDRVAQT
ncbi:MAG: TauD/TfdA family dioxygenase [Gammaproteobacteria bacterium]